MKQQTEGARWFTVGELRAALAQFNDNDEVVVEIHEGERTEDLYPFYVDSIDINRADGLHVRKEVRICI